MYHLDACPALMAVWACGRVVRDVVALDLDLGSIGIRQSRSSIQTLALTPTRRYADTKTDQEDRVVTLNRYLPASRDCNSRSDGGVGHRLSSQCGISGQREIE
jgi:hypothetical protein